ncbi:MAG: S8 family peptidase [Meiothermus sp.]|uniref:S8 family peptidase n=1 Tax=Meiothermus sp. TaxID=1955249 RepID=UPI00298F0F10|nr:S8 family peptidase [Meiothermus sp.]MDW8092030.1 S8 family peptidase [Meiothermus sp.]
MPTPLPTLHRPMRAPSRASLALLSLALLSCNSGSPDIAGTVSLQLGSSGQTPQVEFVPGELIVRPEGPSLQRLTLEGGAAPVVLQQVRPLGLEGAYLYRFEGAADPVALAERLSREPGVRYAQPNYIRRALATPNDELYPLQWHYPAIRLPQAWDIERGQRNPVVVAVVDTGVALGHPDLRGRLLPGYDFVSNPEFSGDGNGRDPDPDETAVGSYHGTHVAGTVAAATDNRTGVAGVSWGARVLPVRVLGENGGVDSDIIDGVLWAAGFSVPGAPANPNPAQVINMSLGGSPSCSLSPALQEAFERVRGRGVVVVAAAGNEALPTHEFAPASCSGVIAVGATERRGYRAFYSNYGPRTDLMAPGGDTTEDRDGDGNPDGVLSTIVANRRDLIYGFEMGTSMAAPHVAGVVALLRSLRPGLTPAEALSVLQDTARPLDGTACTGRPSAALEQGPDLPPLAPRDCGAGLIDAEAALRRLQGGYQGFQLRALPAEAPLVRGGRRSFQVFIERFGGFAGPVSLELLDLPRGVQGRLTGEGDRRTLELSVSDATPTGSFTLRLRAAGEELPLPLQVLEGPRTATLEGTLVYACYLTGREEEPCDGLAEEGGKSRALILRQAARSAPFRFEQVAQGEYVVLAWKDLNANGRVDPLDYLGAYPEPVRPGNLRVDFGIGPQYRITERQKAALERARR